MSRRINDLTGKRFNRLLVISKSEKRNKKGCIYWQCICDCGSEHFAIGGNLLTGSVGSCGCLAKEKSAIRARELFSLVPKDCRISGCTRPTNKGSWGYCAMHTQRIKRHGDPHCIGDAKKAAMKKRFREMERRPISKKSYHKFYGRHEHRVIGETIAKRKLLRSEHVHHKNENKHDNHVDNLEIMSASEHARHHHAKK